MWLRAAAFGPNPAGGLRRIVVGRAHITFDFTCFGHSGLVICYLQSRGMSRSPAFRAGVRPMG
jgi:hypothetical protein